MAAVNKSAQPSVSFGFRDVSAEEKPELVREVFSSVAERYDLMNDLMSAGVHRVWKGAFVDWLNPQPGIAHLDVAGGTGDIAFRIAERVRARKGAADITVCDINTKMLAQGMARARKSPAPIAWLCGDAEDLPIDSASRDSYTIAFGIRNVTHIDKALSEAYRVLKPGRALSLSRVFAGHRAGIGSALRSLFLRSIAAPWRSDCRRRRSLSLFGGKHS